MQIVVWIIMVVLILVALYFYYQFEKNNEEILNLESKLDEEVCAKKELQKKLEEEQKHLLNVKKVAVEQVKKEVYELVFQSQHYESVENLKNKMKTVLEEVGNH